MILAKKVRLYPTELQKHKLWQSIGTARFIYNWTLNRQEENYKNGKEFAKTKNIIKYEKKIQLIHRRLANIR